MFSDKNESPENSGLFSLLEIKEASPLTQEKEQYMRLALALAQKGEGHVAPNPLVGCVIVKDGRIIAEGWHERFGGPHAEKNALAHCTEDPAGAALFVTMEPCCHYGKTPPCTQAIIASGIRKVFVGCVDPNPNVAGKGIAALRQARILVEEGVLEEPCRRINERFFHFITTKKPFVALKYAMTLDGKIATATGESRWITGITARNHVQRLRKQYSAILVGIGTVLADDPLLTCRIDPEASPLRVICDRNLRLPLESQLVQTARQSPVLVLTQTDGEKAEALRAQGVEVVCFPHLTMKEAVDELGRRNIDSLLVEGGSQILGAFVQEGIGERVFAYLAPKILGGYHAPSPIGGPGIGALEDAWTLTDREPIFLGEDLLWTGRVRHHVYGLD